ncbi:hypothetical protein Sjap_017077 [Stephania japonica]|uniref:Dof zinc finger protein n=1 Tax=Stephania japonica TaxID=461633 RepID=A0AAP0I5H6_9MAGN
MADKKPAAAAAAARPEGAGDSPPLPCPRCESTNTKFCYYNNYNLSQPRHFCKACRRYWTHGGTLRNIPVGGATRKHAKRCRTSRDGTAPNAIPIPITAPVPISSALPPSVSGSFTSLLSDGGLGLGLGMGMGMGWGLGYGFELGYGSSHGEGGWGKLVEVVGTRG